MMFPQTQIYMEERKKIALSIIIDSVQVIVGFSTQDAILAGSALMRGG